MAEKQPFNDSARLALKSASVVVAWSEDAGKLGGGVSDYLCVKLGGRELAEIEPVDFFSMGGILVEDDIAQFPESKFYWCEQKSLAIFKSAPPTCEWYEFLNSLLDIAERFCRVEELYTIGGMVSASAHTTPRVLLAVANGPEMKRVLSHYDLTSDMDYETSPGQRPTLSSFLLWVAKRRDIAGASLWVPVPFYLMAANDLRAWKKTAEFFDIRFGLNLDFEDLDEEIVRQNEKIAQARSQFPELNDYISRLESNLSLTDDESERLAREIQEFLA